MRWIPTKIALWTPGTAFSPFLRRANRAGILGGTRESVARLRWLVGGLSFAGLSTAGEVDAVSPLDPAGGHWPWIAVVAILGLLGVVAFASRRRSHAVARS